MADQTVDEQPVDPNTLQHPPLGVTLLGDRTDPRLGPSVLRVRRRVERALRELADHVGHLDLSSLRVTETPTDVACAAVVEVRRVEQPGDEPGLPLVVALNHESARMLADHLLLRTTLAHGAGALTSTDGALLRWLIAAVVMRVGEMLGEGTRPTVVDFGIRDEAAALLASVGDRPQAAGFRVRTAAGIARVTLAAPPHAWTTATLGDSESLEAPRSGTDTVAVHLELPRRIPRRPEPGEALLLGATDMAQLRPWQLTDGWRYRFADADVVTATADTIDVRRGTWNLAPAWNVADPGLRIIAARARVRRSELSSITDTPLTLQAPTPGGVELCNEFGERVAAAEWSRVDGQLALVVAPSQTAGTAKGESV